MNPATRISRWNLIQEIFQGALERDPSERSRYLAEACGYDTELRVEVESLIASDSDAGAVLESLVAGDIREMEQASGSSEEGSTLGPYRLLRELDSGGMGIVYLAVRSDDQYFQIVAVKMMRKGLETPSLVQRFRSERQMLANLNHPNIGAILDGGETRDGRPYIVMEYVEGQPITDACETAGLTIRERVELFRSVCSAVHWAHQKLIVHRDIKPSNVLVTPQGIVKLIDFGVAKPLGPELIPGGAPQTETAHRLLTPDYASPEQLLGREITTATDIYSLGILLFEVLTGSRPYTLRDLSPAEAERVVCQAGVRKPSTVRGLPARTRKEIAGDLDRIVAMAMEVDCVRRYQSAQKLEEDLVRFLQGKPILARRATSLYRFGKFVQRHRPAATVTCAGALALCGSLVYHSCQSSAAEARIKQVQTLANATISDIGEKLQQSSASVEAQALLFHSALNYLEQLRRNSGNDPRLLLELSKAYTRVGDLEGSPFVANLGNTGTAVTSYQNALQSALEAHAGLRDETSARAVIDSYQRLARIQTSQGDVEAAEKNYRQCLALMRDLWGQNPADPGRKQLVATNYLGLGVIRFDSREPDKALENFRAALRTVGSEMNGNEEHDRTLAALYLRIGRTLNELRPGTEAIASFRKGITITEDLARRSPPPKQITRSLFAMYHTFVLPLAGEEMLNVGDTQQGELYARKALGMAEALAASDSKNAQARADLAFAYWAMGNVCRLEKPASAAHWYRMSIELTRLIVPRSDAQHFVAFREEALASVLMREDQASERLRLLEAANAQRRQLASTDPDVPERRLHMMRSYCRLSEAALGVRDVTKARQYGEAALPYLKEFKPDSPSLLVLREVGSCDESMGNLRQQMAKERSLTAAQREMLRAESLEWYRKSLAVWSEWGRRGAATPESERERVKVERILGMTSKTATGKVELRPRAAGNGHPPQSDRK